MKTHNGAVFGLWTVLDRIDSNYVLCRCDCGTEKRVYKSNLTSNKSTSCGCERARINGELHTKHNGHGTPTYSTWSSMLTRCTNSKSKSFRNYGGRGITVCDRWLSYENFKADMGEKSEKGISIERLDYNGNYEPGNCVWATQKEQNRNKRNTKLNLAQVQDLRSGIVSIQEVIDATGCAKSTASMARSGANWNEE